MPVIDVHTHAYTREYLELLRTKGGIYSHKMRPDGQEEIFRGDTPVALPQPGHLDYDLCIADMDANHIDVAIVSLTCPNCHWGGEVELPSRRVIGARPSAYLKRIWYDGICYSPQALSSATPSERETRLDCSTSRAETFRADRTHCDGEHHAVDTHAIEQIETKIAYLERANAELSDVVFRQHRDIEALREQIAALTSRVQAHEEDVAPRRPEDERPPHY